MQVDLQTDQLVATLVWPLERYGCIAELQQLGHDALVRHSCVLHACQQLKCQATSHMVRLRPVTLTTIHPPPPAFPPLPFHLPCNYSVIAASRTSCGVWLRSRAL